MTILLHSWIILSHNIVTCEIRICGPLACPPFGKAMGFNWVCSPVQFPAAITARGQRQALTAIRD